MYAGHSLINYEYILMGNMRRKTRMRDIQMLYVKLEGNFSMKEKVVVDKAISLHTE